MSPTQALHSPIFLTYLVLVAGVLAFAGGVIAFFQWGLHKPMRSVWLTYKGWLIMVPIVTVAGLLGRWAVIVGAALLSIFGFKEFARATGLYRDWWMTGAVYLAIVALAAASAMNDPFNGHPGWFGLYMAMPVFAINLLVIIPVIRNQPKGQLQGISLSILGFIYIGWMFGHLGFLANSNNPYGYLLFLVLATELNDVAAFTFGKLFGHRPLRSNISPRKTWGGAIGAAVFSMGVPWALRFSFPNFSTTQLLLTGLIVGVGGQLGDLSISVLKRDIGVKDMGGSIPGHGGVLDRIDSLIFVAPLFTHMVHYFNGLR
jgi:phosphatidate cytidylyltransferase